MMADSGGGKSKSKRFHGTSKPYERRQSFFGSLTDTVKSVVTPSWLTDLVRTVKRSSKSDDSITEEKGREEKEIFPSNSSNLKSNTAEYGQLPNNSVQPRTDTFRGFTSGSPLSENNYTFEGVSKKNESMNLYPSNSSRYKEEQPQVKESTEILQNGRDGEMEHSVGAPSVKLNQAATWTAEYNTKMSRKPAVWKTPGFDVTLFGTSDEKRSNAGRESYHMSPFYSGKTCFGGALSQKSRMNRTAPDLKYPCPVRQKIQPKTKNQESTSTAKRILATLQKMSTPLNDARKIPFEDSVLFDSPTPVGPRGPPRRQLTTPLAASVTKNRQRIRIKETQPTKCQDELPTETETKSKFLSDSTYSAGGKLKEKKFSQHISKRGSFYDEEVELPNLRTEFTLPIENITGMKFGILEKENGNKDKGQRNAMDGVFTFSSPVQKGQILNTTSPVPKMNFTFSSPIKVHSPQTSVSPTSVNVGEGKSTADHIFQPSTLKPHPGKTEINDGEGKSKFPVKTWDCDVCLVPNKMENAKCLACESPRSGSQPSTSGFMVKPKAFSSQTGFVVESDGPTKPGVKEFSLNGDGINKPAPVEKTVGNFEKDTSSFEQNWNLDRKTKSSVEENNGSKMEKTSEGSFLKNSGILKDNESPRKNATLPEKKETEQRVVNFTMPTSLTSISNVPATKESGESNKGVVTFTSPFPSNSMNPVAPAPMQFNKMSSNFGAPVSTMNKEQIEKNQDYKVLTTAPSFSVVQNTTPNSTVTFQFGVNSMTTTSVTSSSFQFGQSTTPNSNENFQFSVNSSKASSGVPSHFQFGQSNSIDPKSNATFQFGADSSITSSASLSSPFQFSSSAASGASMSAKTVPLQVAASSTKAVCSPSSMFSLSVANSGSLGNTTTPGSQGGPSINSKFGFAGQAPTFGTSVSLEKEKPAGFNFSFGAAKSSGAVSSSLFQFGNQQQSSITNENQPSLNGGLNPTPQGIFSFSAAPQQNPPQPSLPAATSFNAIQSNTPTAGSSFFNIGASNESGRRVVKKAVRKLKR